jgi:hypothetical protein
MTALSRPTARQSDILLARDLDPDTLRQLQRCEGTTSRRVRRGVYVAAEPWTAADTYSRHLTRVLAVDTTHRHPVFGHVSAAAIWGLPLADRPWPGEVHVIAASDSHARSKNGVVVHRQLVNDGDVIERDGLLVTTLERTVIDLARTMPFPVAVAAIDHSLYDKRARTHVLTKEQLGESLLRTPNTNGRARARRAIDAARVGADNAGETLSRLAIVKLGFPEPLLQVRHVNPRGGFYYTDHEWPAHKAIAEFDGFGKYLGQALRLEQRAGDVVYEEKIREDHLRAENNGVARWGPPELRTPSEIARRLIRIGVPRIAPR